MKKENKTVPEGWKHACAPLIAWLVVAFLMWAIIYQFRFSTSVKRLDARIVAWEHYMEAQEPQAKGRTR